MATESFNFYLYQQQEVKKPGAQKLEIHIHTHFDREVITIGSRKHVKNTKSHGKCNKCTVIQ